uniref:7TM_GPCR_Srx domain-containing protein n=1 Tax=Strongyloides papillosus TaxID=174720 RepID=A0A0N5BMB0_STREA
MQVPEFNTQRKKKKSHYLEIRLFFQAITHFLYTVILQACFVAGRVWFPTYENLFRILNLAWVVSIGCNTIFNIIFLKDIRIIFFKQFTCCINKNKVTQIGTTNTWADKVTQGPISRIRTELYLQDYSN